MAEYADLIELQLAGPTVRSAQLVFFDFRSGPQRYWSGFGDLVTLDGNTWTGIGNLGALSPITAGLSGPVEEMTLSLSGDALALQHVREDHNDTVGREVEIFDQFFDIRKQDASGAYVDWKLIGAPESWFWGKMGPVNVKIDPPGENGRAMRVVSVVAQNAMINAARPVNSFFSDRDQRSRTDGTDQIFINVAQFAEGTVRWPIF